MRSTSITCYSTRLKFRYNARRKVKIAMYNFEHSAQVKMQSALRHRWQVEKMQKVLISIFPRFGTNPECKLLNIFNVIYVFRLNHFSTILWNETEVIKFQGMTFCKVVTIATTVSVHHFVDCKWCLQLNLQDKKVGPVTPAKDLWWLQTDSVDLSARWS